MTAPAIEVWPRFTGRYPLLPVHQPWPGDDFMPAGWCGACETCGQYPASEICMACSYDDDGRPVRPVPYPCPVARGAER